jgi:hypothetical protein
MNFKQARRLFAETGGDACPPHEKTPAAWGCEGFEKCVIR